MTFATFSKGAVAELKMPPRSLGRLLQHHLNQPTTNPTQPLVTQMQPPMLPPPPHPNFQSVDLHTRLPKTRDPLLLSNSEPSITPSQTSVVTSEVLGTTIQYPLTESQSHLASTSSRIQFQQHVSDELLTEPDSQGSNIRVVSLSSQITEPFTETSMSQPLSKLSETGPFGFLKMDSYSQTLSHSPASQTKMSHSGSVTQSSASQAELHQIHQLVTKSQFYQSHHEPTSTQISQTKLEHPDQLLHPKTDLQLSPTLSQRSHSDSQQTFSLFPKFHLELSTVQHYPPSTQLPPSSKPQQPQINSHPPPSLPKPTSTTSTLPQTQPQSSPTQHPLLHSQTETFSLQHRNPPKIQPSISTIHPPDQTAEPSTSDPQIPIVHEVTMSDHVTPNTSQQGDPVKSAKSANDTELTEWLKRNTSQSPMTSNDPR